MWFLGIIFRRVENAESVNIDLTYDIQSFTDTGKTLSSLELWCSTLAVTQYHLPRIWLAIFFKVPQLVK